MSALFVVGMTAAGVYIYNIRTSDSQSDVSQNVSSKDSTPDSVISKDKTETPGAEASKPAAAKTPEANGPKTPATNPTATKPAPPTNSGSSTTPVAPPPPPGGLKLNCISVPSSCGYPDATNTGVPSGMSLTNSGSITVTTDGTVIDRMNVNGQIAVRANNVTIKNTRITSGDYYPIDYDGYTGLVVQDTEIYGTNTDVTAGMSFVNYTARRVHIHGTVDGFKADANVLIEDSYVTGLRYDAVRDTHNDGVQTTGGSNVTLRHNTFKLGGITGISSVIQIGTEGGPNNNWLVVDNLIDGGGWSVNAQAVSAGSNRIFTNNRFTRAHGYGVGDVPSSTWSGNFYDNNGEAINK